MKARSSFLIYYIFIVLVGVTHLGCEKDDNVIIIPEEPPIVLSDCTFDSTTYTPTPFRYANHPMDRDYSFNIDQGCDPEFEPGCTLMEVPDTFYLKDRAQQFLPQSGMEIGDHLFYVNADNEYLPFEIIDKQHEIAKSYFTLYCPTDQGYCFNTERYEVKMYSLDCKYQLSIEVRTSIRFYDNGAYKQQDGMGITDPNYNKGFNAIFYLPLYDSVDIDAVYYPTLNFMGEEYQEVYSMNQYNKMQVYYNTTYGLLGFKDEEGEEWKLYR